MVPSPSNSCRAPGKVLPNRQTSRSIDPLFDERRFIISPVYDEIPDFAVIGIGMDCGNDAAMRSGQGRNGRVAVGLSPRTPRQAAFDQCLHKRFVAFLITVLTSVPFGMRARRRIITIGVPLAT